MLDRNSTTIGAAAIGSASRSAASLEGGMRHLRPKLTYANVISTLCLFLLLGGGAYAATELSPNSVGAKQLRRHAVIPSKLSRATVKKLHRAVGARGPKGDKGDAGPAGPSDTYIAGSAGAKLTKTSKEVVSITVPAGSYLLGAKAAVLTNGTNEAGTGFCSLASPGSSEGSDSYEFTLAAISGENSNTDVSLSSAASFASQQAVLLSCSASKGTLVAEDARVWAIKVGSLQGLPVPTD